jgi:dTDP-4-dehydrorhamnose reductase
MKKILLLGKNGQVGWELCRTLSPLGSLIDVDYPEIDFSDSNSLTSLVEREHPSIVVNAAAYTAVDRAETEASLARAINATAPGVLAKAAHKIGAVFIHYSTDYVFDGLKGSEYIEADQPNPINMYGQTKLDGENEVFSAGGVALVLRTSWVFSNRRDSFVAKVLSWSRSQSALRIVTDQIGSPTWARILAETTAQIIAMGGSQPYEWLEARQGVYHLAGLGSASRFTWAEEILKNDPHPEAQVVKELLPALSSEFSTPAQRPLFTGLNCDLFTKTFGLQLPDWRKALKMAMEAR